MDQSGSEPAPPTLTVEQRRAALSLVRRAVEDFVRGGRESDPPADLPFRSTVSGAFVTLKRLGVLRGCIGTVESRRPLGETLVHCAISAAIQDQRFPPVAEAELPELRYEISLLSPPREAKSEDEIQVGTHGILVESGDRRGLLLPQVAVAQRWDRRTFLEQTCLKAGLPACAWQAGARFWIFTAEVFGEDSP